MASVESIKQPAEGEKSRSYHHSHPEEMRKDMDQIIHKLFDDAEYVYIPIKVKPQTNSARPRHFMEWAMNNGIQQRRMLVIRILHFLSPPIVFADSASPDLVCHDASTTSNPFLEHGTLKPVLASPLIEKEQTIVDSAPGEDKPISKFTEEVADEEELITRVKIAD